MDPIELCINKQQDQSQIMKGKRTKRPRLPSPLRLTMATSSPGRSTSSDQGGLINNYDMATTTSTHHIMDHDEQLRESTEEEEDMANCLILLAQGHTRKPIISDNKVYVYQCKTCERCFPSFQALGGHRASHKKPKPNIMNTRTQSVSFGKEEVDGRYEQVGTTSTTLSLYSSSSSSSKCKVHECSICGAEFSSGQALGGHMRRHRTFVHNSTTTTSANAHATNSEILFQEPKNNNNNKPRNVLKLDLNLPAPDDHDHTHRESKLSFPASKENLLVFSASSLVDCHY